MIHTNLYYLVSLVLITVLFHLLPTVVFGDFVFSTDVSGDERYIHGKKQYEMWQQETKAPRYGECWTAALEELDSGCRGLTEDVQHHLALQFTNCFLIKTGRDPYPCSDQEVTECVRPMTTEAYGSYTTFFTHTQNICFYLLAQIWQESTERTINHLSDNSETVARQLENSSHLQAELMRKQNDSLRNQEKLLESGEELKNSLQESSADVHKMMSEFKEATSEQKALIFEVFDRVSQLQSIVMGELTGFYSLIFYALSIVVSYLLTSTPRASGARFWLFSLMTINMVVERMIVMWGVNDDGEKFLDENVSVSFQILCLFHIHCTRAHLFIANILYSRALSTTACGCVEKFSHLLGLGSGSFLPTTSKI